MGQRLVLGALGIDPAQLGHTNVCFSASSFSGKMKEALRKALDPAAFSPFQHSTELPLRRLVLGCFPLNALVFFKSTEGSSPFKVLKIQQLKREREKFLFL